DPRDYIQIAESAWDFDNTIVECHPRLVNQRAVEFQNMLPGRLEVAMGLEAADDQILDKLNKRVRLEDIRKASRFLEENDVAIRMFVLVKPPFVASESSALELARRSID